MNKDPPPLSHNTTLITSNNNSVPLIVNNIGFLDYRRLQHFVQEFSLSLVLYQLELSPRDPNKHLLQRAYYKVNTS